jgi:uncharacterized RDD family membrane protein YckC
MTDPGAPDLPPFPEAPSSPAYAPPAPAPPPGIPVPVATVTYAGFWLRFVAVLIDTVILVFVRVCTAAVIRASAGVPAWPPWRELESMQTGIGCSQELIGIVVWWLYHALLESSAAQGTLGKQALHLRVTDLYGRRISFGRATGRTFAKVLSAIKLGIGYLMEAFTARKQALHVFVAETVVLRVNG